VIIQGAQYNADGSCNADWLQMRCGSATASRLNDALAKKSRSEAFYATREKYCKELAIERLTGKTQEHYVSPAMEWGAETEKQARVEYEILTGNTVQQIALAMHPTINYFSASTDGLVGDDGILEIKCLNSENHIDILLNGEIPAEYYRQMFGGMACAERSFCDFVSFDPRLPEQYQLFVKRFYRDNRAIAELEQGVQVFLAEVEELLLKLKMASEGKSFTEYQLKRSLELVSNAR
jgi:putative phage-type endonuclease